MYQQATIAPCSCRLIQKPVKTRKQMKFAYKPRDKQWAMLQRAAEGTVLNRQCERYHADSLVDVNIELVVCNVVLLLCGTAYFYR